MPGILYSELNNSVWWFLLGYSHVFPTFPKYDPFAVSTFPSFPGPVPSRMIWVLILGLRKDGGHLSDAEFQLAKVGSGGVG